MQIEIPGIVVIILLLCIFGLAIRGCSDENLIEVHCEPKENAVQTGIRG
jgi:hypothetical protein